MTKEIWINLPVKDVQKSKDFFKAIGFKENHHAGNSDVSASLFVGTKNVVLMLFAEHVFKSFTNIEITDTKASCEVLFSIDAETREEVDALAQKITEAGGTLDNTPSDNQGWMYGFVFSDPDGHKWNVLYMDMSKMPKG